MLAVPQFPVRIYFDGACSVCAREVEHYRRMDRAGQLVPVDISAADFDPRPCGVSLQALQFELHVIDRKGMVYRGVDAFWAIWQAFPGSIPLRILGTLVTLPLVRPLARSGYRLFARIRPYLPKSRFACSGGVCRIGRK